MNDPTPRKVVNDDVHKAPKKKKKALHRTVADSQTERGK